MLRACANTVKDLGKSLWEDYGFSTISTSKLERLVNQESAAHSFYTSLTLDQGHYEHSLFMVSNLKFPYLTTCSTTPNVANK